MRLLLKLCSYLLVINFLSSCSVFKSGPGDGIPRFLSGVEWEMAADELLEKRNIEKVHERPYREVYLESNSNNDEVEDIIYYFGVIEGEVHRPLYEIIINYSSEVLRDKNAQKLLGEPNTEDGEWKWTDGNASYRAWTFQNKLVIVKIVPGTEWG